MQAIGVAFRLRAIKAFPADFQRTLHLHFKAVAHLHASGEDRFVKIIAPPIRILRGSALSLSASITALGDRLDTTSFPPRAEGTVLSRASSSEPR